MNLWDLIYSTDTHVMNSILLQKSVAALCADAEKPTGFLYSQNIGGFFEFHRITLVSK